MHHQVLAPLRAEASLCLYQSCGNFDDKRLWMLAFLRYWLTICNERLDIEADGVLRHSNSLLDGLTLRYTPRQSWYGYRVTSLFRIGVKDDCVLIFTHCYIPFVCYSHKFPQIIYTEASLLQDRCQSLWFQRYTHMHSYDDISRFIRMLQCHMAPTLTCWLPTISSQSS